MSHDGDQSYSESRPTASVINAHGRSPVILVCEHAANHIPARFDGLGLSGEARTSHIAWDPGALAVARQMSNLLDARLVAAEISRLVYDCNRPPEAPDAIPAISASVAIPGNTGLSQAEKRDRVARYYVPFRDLLAGTIAAAPAPVLVTVHSFTPEYLGQVRAVELGIVHDTDARLADEMLKLSARRTSMTVRRNDPYGPEDGVTHTLRTHGLKDGLLNVMLEIRNDLIATEHAQRAMAEALCGLLAAALSSLGVDAKLKDTECPDL